MILNKAVYHKFPEKLLILTQGDTPLQRALAKAYAESGITARPLIRVLDLANDSAEDIHIEISVLRPDDLLVTVQDEEYTFKLGNNYRLRATLFSKGIKNVDHKFLSGTCAGK